MGKKRRRLLMASQVDIKRTDDPITVCPNCGDDGSDETYSDMSTYVAYCSGCDAYTEHYHCDYYDDAEGTYCNTSWCSVCGNIPTCPNCGQDTLRWTHGTCDYGCDLNYYVCQNCGHTVGDTGEGHIDCDIGEEDDSGDTTPEVVWTCPTCEFETTRYPSTEEWDCPNCETDNSKSYICPNCQSVVCSNCGYVIAG